jgi:hypothetical protein
VIPLILRVTSLEAAMMGRQTGDQASLFYEFRLDDRIPKDHLLRRINVVVGPVLDGVRGQLMTHHVISRPAFAVVHNRTIWCVSAPGQLQFLSGAGARVGPSH